MNTSIQIKTHTSSSARNKNAHILRDSDAYKNPCIITLVRLDKKFTKSKKEKPNKKEKTAEADRQKKLKNVNSNINTYKRRINNLNEELDKKRILKMQMKLEEYYKKREELKAQKINETRGRKKEKEYVEFEICLTGVVPNDNLSVTKHFAELQTKFLQNSFFSKLELITNVIHLDQYSLHSHALFKLPENMSWKNYLKQFKEDGRKVYKMISNGWRKYCDKSKIEEIIGDKFEPQQSGKRYVSLKKYKDITDWNNEKKSSIIRIKR